MKEVESIQLTVPQLRLVQIPSVLAWASSLMERARWISLDFEPVEGSETKELKLALRFLSDHKFFIRSITRIPGTDGRLEFKTMFPEKLSWQGKTVGAEVCGYLNMDFNRGFINTPAFAARSDKTWRTNGFKILTINDI